MSNLVAMELLVSLLVISHLSVSWACSTHGRWREMPIEERLFKSQVVVIGRDVKHYQVKTVQGFIRTDVLFEVDCILKNARGGVPRNITILRLSPRECSDTVVTVGRRYIMAIKRTGNLNFEFHEVNSLQSAAFSATEENLQIATGVCGLTEPDLPYDNRDYIEGTDSPPSCPEVHPEKTLFCSKGGAWALVGHYWLVAVIGATLLAIA